MASSNFIGRLLRRHLPITRSRGAVLKKFAKKIGLVYFGVVDQHIDEHDVIRGLTVSTTHVDDHYTVGAYDGYDVSLVDRFDIVVDRHNVSSEHTWTILRLNLDKSEALPHLFLYPLGQKTKAYNKFFEATHHLQVVNSLFQGAHSQEFHNRYSIYTSSSHALSLEELLTPTVTQTIAATLWPHAIEILDNKLYLYIIETKLSETLLETGLSSVLWLARVLEQTEEN
ncbi:MAG: hypothetical protein JWM52_851 [Candidatus Saccharibacteria bacterium]|nr:hypothetical protein [Candidatus Saccharibacteria bacterium]